MSGVVNKVAGFRKKRSSCQEDVLELCDPLNDEQIARLCSQDDLYSFDVEETASASSDDDSVDDCSFSDVLHDRMPSTASNIPNKGEASDEFFEDSGSRERAVSSGESDVGKVKVEVSPGAQHISNKTADMTTISVQSKDKSAYNFDEKSFYDGLIIRKDKDFAGGGEDDHSDIIEKGEVDDVSAEIASLLQSINNSDVEHDDGLERESDRQTVESLFADVVQPYLSNWLNDNIPKIIQAAVAKEVNDRLAISNKKAKKKIKNKHKSNQQA